MTDYFEQRLKERQERDRMFADWQALLGDLTTKLFVPQVYPRLLHLKLLRREGETFIIEFNEREVGYLKARVPGLYAELSEKCRMVRRGDADET